MLSPLGMPDDHIGAAGLFEQRRADFAGPGAFVLPEAILRRDANVGPLEPLRHRRNRSEHGCDGNLGVANGPELIAQLGHEGDCFGDRLLQLPIATDEWNASHYSSSTAMPGSFFPSRNSSEAPPPVE